ncbi:MAG: gamma carbonic anhydrase family protein [Candidatus Krumholzibacteriia bacterium]
MLVAHCGARPTVHETAYVAPNAVLSGDVTVGENSVILFGAVITAEGGAVNIGSECIIMENAVIRGAPKHPARLGHRVLVGPHAHLTGCTVADEAFLATGVTVFNGVRLGRSVEVRINGIVHVNSVLAPNAVVPIGWVAVGNPAAILPPDQHEEIWRIQRSMDFAGTVFGMDRSVPQGERTRRYARALLRHRQDRLIPQA